MVKKILTILLPLVMFIGGALAGDMLHSGKPAEDEHGATTHDEANPDAHGETTAASNENGSEHEDEAETEVGWFRFPNQFFIPIVRNGNIDSTMIMTVTLETAGGAADSVAGKEHRLRDSLLRSLMIHANTGGFDGNFTAEGRLRGLREALLKAAKGVGGDEIRAVLIEDIVRQEK